MTPDMVPAIGVEDLTVGFENRPALLSGFSLKVFPGECVVVRGESGSGKSTLLHCLCGLIPRSVPAASWSGEIRLFGRPVESYARHELVSAIGIVFQDPDTQIFCDTVEDEIAFGMENICLPRAEMSDRMEECLALAGLGKYRRTSPRCLSGGQKQLVALAAVLALRPRILLLDEAFSQLDDTCRARMLAYIAGLRRDGGRTVVLTSHGNDYGNDTNNDNGKPQSAMPLIPAPGGV